MTVAQDFGLGWRKMIVTVGTNFTVEDLSGVVTKDVKMHFIAVNKDDLAILNTFGLDARVAASLPDLEIKKGMKVTAPSGKFYNVEAAHEVWVQDTLIGYRVYMM